MNNRLDNANPVIYESSKEREINPEDEDDAIVDKIDEREVFGEDSRGSFLLDSS